MSSIYDALKQIQQERNRVYNKYVLYPVIRIKKSMSGWLMVIIVAGGITCGFMLAVVMKNLYVSETRPIMGVKSHIELLEGPSPQAKGPVVDKKSAYPVKMVNTLLVRANFKKNAGDLFGAIDLYRRVIKLKPDAVKVYMNLGSIYYAVHEYDKSLSMYTKADTLKKNDASILNNIGTVLLAKGDAEKAIDYFKRSIGVSKNYVEPVYNMACAYAKKGDIQSAMSSLKKAISMSSRASSWAVTDPDLKVLRGVKEFNNMLGPLKQGRPDE